MKEFDDLVSGLRHPWINRLRIAFSRAAAQESGESRRSESASRRRGLFFSDQLAATEAAK
jgi:hypothetical protein